MRLTDDKAFKVDVITEKNLHIEVVKKWKKYLPVQISSSDDKEAIRLENKLGLNKWKVTKKQRRRRLVMLALMKLFENNKGVIFRKKQLSGLILVDNKNPCPQCCEEYSDFLSGKERIRAIIAGKSKFYTFR
jgi:hypothetical protein